MKFTRGDRVEGWTAAGLPQATRLSGRSVYLRPLEAGLQTLRMEMRFIERKIPSGRPSARVQL